MMSRASARYCWAVESPVGDGTTVGVRAGVDVGAKVGVAACGAGTQEVIKNANNRIMLITFVSSFISGYLCRKSSGRLN